MSLELASCTEKPQSCVGWQLLSFNIQSVNMTFKNNENNCLQACRKLAEKTDKVIF